MYHVVQKGDTLFGISELFYGSGKYTKVIYEANKHIMIEGADVLKLGWKLRIPSPQEVAGQ